MKIKKSDGEIDGYMWKENFLFSTTKVPVTVLFAVYVACPTLRLNLRSRLMSSISSFPGHCLVDALDVTQHKALMTFLGINICKF